MKPVSLAIAFTFLASCALAQVALGPPPEPPRAEASPDKVVKFNEGKVTLSIKNSPVGSALDQLFKMAGKSFSMDTMANSMANSSMVTIQIQDATFEQALDALAKAAGLTYKVEHGVYMLTQKRMLGGYSGGLAPPSERPAEPQPIYLRLDAMPVHQAYAAVIKASGAPDDLRWQFKGDLSQTVMPGAAFSAIPVKMAAAIVVAAAGLVPPSGAETIIARKGSADLSVFITSDPSGGWAGYGPSLASYKGFHGVWRYFINASIDVPSLLKAFLPTSTSFVIDDRRAGKDSPAPRASVRLMNVTLDEALDAILGPTGYTSTKRNGVYMIRQGAGSAAATTTQPSRKRKGNK